jgi:hypothetical protein
LGAAADGGYNAVADTITMRYQQSDDHLPFIWRRARATTKRAVR